MCAVGIAAADRVESSESKASAFVGFGATDNTAVVARRLDANAEAAEAAERNAFSALKADATLTTEAADTAWRLAASAEGASARRLALTDGKTVGSVWKLVVNASERAGALDTAEASKVAGVSLGAGFATMETAVVGLLLAIGLAAGTVLAVIG